VSQEDQIGGSDCEEIGEGLLVQPVNALSSLAFVAAGVAVVVRARGLDIAIKRQAWLFAALLILTGLGSVVYHGPQWPGARFMHDAPIALIVIQSVVTPLWRFLRKQPVLPGWTPKRGASLAVAWLLAAGSFAGGRTDSPLCDPDSVAQPHGSWHVLASVGFFVWSEILFQDARAPSKPDLPISSPRGTERSGDG